MISRMTPSSKTFISYLQHSPCRTLRMTHLRHGYPNGRYIVDGANLLKLVALFKSTRILAPAWGTWPNGERPSAHHCGGKWRNSRGLQTLTQAHASRKHYKSIQDTLLINFDFLHSTQNLHCLKDQWLAGPTTVGLWPNPPCLSLS